MEEIHLEIIRQAANYGFQLRIICCISNVQVYRTLCGDERNTMQLYVHCKQIENRRTPKSETKQTFAERIRAIEQLSSMLLIFIFDFNLFRKNHVLNIKMAAVSSGAVCTFVSSVLSHAASTDGRIRHTHCRSRHYEQHRPNQCGNSASCNGVYKSYGFRHLIRILKMAKSNFIEARVSAIVRTMDACAECVHFEGDSK